MADAAPTSLFPRRRLAGFAVLRILFGVVWAIDASFKWQPAFVNGVTTYLASALKGQPPDVQAWIEFWLGVVKIDPILFARLIAVSETLLAVTLILGLLTNLACLGGARAVLYDLVHRRRIRWTLRSRLHGHWHVDHLHLRLRCTPSRLGQPVPQPRPIPGSLARTMGFSRIGTAVARIGCIVAARND